MCVCVYCHNYGLLTYQVRVTGTTYTFIIVGTIMNVYVHNYKHTHIHHLKYMR